jgi:hypothetical protein
MQYPVDFGKLWLMMEVDGKPFDRKKKARRQMVTILGVVIFIAGAGLLMYAVCEQMWKTR